MTDTPHNDVYPEPRFAIGDRVTGRDVTSYLEYTGTIDQIIMPTKWDMPGGPFGGARLPGGSTRRSPSGRLRSSASPCALPGRAGLRPFRQLGRVVRYRLTDTDVRYSNGKPLRPIVDEATCSAPRPIRPYR